MTHILSSFPTLSLLQLRLVSHHLHGLIVRIVHQRLLLAASLKDRKLILECYHPSAQYTEPYVFCDYLGTPGLSSEKEGQGSLYRDLKLGGGQLKHVYSRFRPSRRDDCTGNIRPHPAGDVPGSRTHPIVQGSASKADVGNSDLVTHKVFLDSHEPFTQLSITAALVQVGPRRGVFVSFIDVVDKKNPRIWRNWLEENARIPTTSRRKGNQVNEDEHQRTESTHIIWADTGKTLGLKVRVKENKWRTDTPILLHRDEDQAISYSLEFEGRISQRAEVICTSRDG